MKKFLLAILAAVTIPALAGTATISTGPLSATCESGGGSITQAGEIYIVCLTDPVLYGIDGPLWPAPAPTPTPAPAPCPSSAAIDTGLITAAWPQHSYSPAPSAISAFKITVPAGYSGRSTFSAAQTSASARAKLLVVSTCPGVLTPVGGQRACSVIGTEVSSLRMSGKASDPSYYCKLAPGVYYVNAASKHTVTDTSYNCSTTTNCSFYASRGAPY